MDKRLMLSYGIDYDAGIRICMGSVACYKKILSMFLDDRCLIRARAACESKSKKELFDCMHELKGVSGNAALTTLYAAALPLVELLRKEGDPFPEAQKLFDEVEVAYSQTCEGIRAYLLEANV